MLKLASLDTPLIELLIPKKWNFVKFEFSYAFLSKIFYEKTDSGMDYWDRLHLSIFAYIRRKREE